MSELSRRLSEAKGDRSIDDIAAEASRHGHPVSRSVVAKYLNGDHGPKPPEATLAGLAAGLSLDVRILRELAQRPAGEPEPWVPTPLSASLSRDQRNALDALIRTIVREEGVRDGGMPEAQKTDLEDRRRRRMREGSLPVERAAYDPERG